LNHIAGAESQYFTANGKIEGLNGRAQGFIGAQVSAYSGR
jgi:hypothetical protein